MQKSRTHKHQTDFKTMTLHQLKKDKEDGAKIKIKQALKADSTISNT